MKFLIAFAALIAVSYAGLAKDLEPALAAANGATMGLDKGLHCAAKPLQNALKSIGIALLQALLGIGKIAGATAAGVGTTIGKVPCAAEETLHRVSTGQGLGKILLTPLLGGSHSSSM